MNNKSRLLNTVNNIYRHHRDGNSALRERRLAAMQLIANDLAQLLHGPIDWSSLNLEHINKLILYWKKSNYKMSSIMNFVAILRHFVSTLQFNVVIPNNKFLGLSKSRIISKTLNGLEPIELIEKIPFPLVKLIFGMEVLFGLSKSEVIKLKTDLNITKEFININRKIAANEQDREIPVITVEQIGLIAKWQQELPVDKAMLDIYPYHEIIGTYKTALRYLGVNTSVQHRCFYAKRRYEQLISTESSKKALETLQQELGISVKQIKRYL